MDINIFFDKHMEILKTRVFRVGERDSFDKADDLYSLLWRLRHNNEKTSIEELIEVLERDGCCPSIFDEDHDCTSEKYNKQECIDCWQKYINSFIEKDGIC